MDDSSVAGSDALFPGPSVASVLGINGPLRFRPHGSNQKAHVVLRRVATPDDSSDDGDLASVVRFSLFAQKRIEVKPGKEILLTVTSEDGKFKDVPVIFEGDRIMFDAFEEESCTQIAEEEEHASYHPPVSQAIPPKMRRAWTKKLEVSPEIQDSSPVSPLAARTSVAVQTEPLRVSSSSVQVQAVNKSVFTQTESISEIPSHTENASLPVCNPTMVRASNPRKHVNSIVQTDAFMYPTQDVDVSVRSSGEPPSGDFIDGRHERQGCRRDRSLSPMELDSSPGSIVASPAIESRRQLEGLSTGIELCDRQPPPSPSTSIASSFGAQDMQMSPVDSRPSSTLIKVAEAVPPLSLSKEGEAKIPDHSDLMLSRSLSDIQSLSGNVTRLTPCAPTTLSVPVVGYGTLYSDDSSIFQKASRIPSYVPRPTVSAAQENILSSALFPGPKNSESVFPTRERQLASSLQPTNQVAEYSPRHALFTPISPVLGSGQMPYPEHIRERVELDKAPVNAVASSSKVLLGQNDAQCVTSNFGDTGRFGTTGISLAQGPALELSVRAREKAPILPSYHTSLDVVDGSAPRETLHRAARRMPALFQSSNVHSYSNVSVLGSQTHQTSNDTHPTWGETGLLLDRAEDVTTDGKTSPPLTSSSWYSYPQPVTCGSDKANLSGKWQRSKLNGHTELSPWLPAFDEHHWDSDCVPGLTASSLRADKEISAPRLVEKPTSSNMNDFPVLDGDNIRNSGQRPAVLGLSMPPSMHMPPIAISSSRSSSDVSGNWNGIEVPRVSGREVQASESQVSAPISNCSPARVVLEQQSSIPGLMSTSVSLAFRSTADGYFNPTRLDASPVPQEWIKQQKRPITPGPRGVKRERSPTPEASSTDFCATLASDAGDTAVQHSSTPREDRVYPWPVYRCDHAAYLSGSGDLAICTISFSSDGSHFALTCTDKTLRIWNNVKRAEIARLSHHSPIVDVTWMEGDIGVVTLGQDGIVGKWTRVGGNFWQWAKIVDAGCETGFEDKTCLAYHRDRIAVSFPKAGVKVWIWLKGTWQAQRSIVRPNVTAIKFMDDGAALLGGTRDGVLWHCEIPNGTLRAYSFLQKSISSLNLSPNGSHVLVGQVGGRARLVSARHSSNRGAVEVSYSLQEQLGQLNKFLLSRPGAVFTAGGEAVLFGSMEGCVLVWDRKRATILYGLEHEKDDIVHAVSCIDGPGNREGWILTGTQKGRLLWWLAQD
ncbi:hypothetical protein AX17_001896 [Amanita inopinata Kibby_2008]|nr:hypothetical protein AX17_001896 [Amanita inopinata Kibby_2008]